MNYLPQFAILVTPFNRMPAPAGDILWRLVSAAVVAQYRDLGRNLRDCAAVSEHRFADLNGTLRTFGTELPPRASTIARATAGLVTAALWWFGARRLREPLQAMWLHALTTSYLMLFNPMNESNSYGILAPALGFWAVDWLSNPDSVHRGRVLGTMSLSMGALPRSLYSWWFVGRTPQGWTSLMMVITLVGSAQLLVLGIIGQYLGRIHEQLKGRPLFIVQSVHRKGMDVPG